MRHPARSAAAGRRLLASSSSKGGSAEVYERKTPLEHVLLRPGMYIGSVAPTRTATWVLEEGSVEEGTPSMERRELDVVPGVCKIFDEILVNAADNLQRDATMNKIEVHINGGTTSEPEISILNNGRGLPVTRHADGPFVPELVFGYLFTGSNFDDDEVRLTGGRHGFGAKLTNIFSNRFEIETVDSRRKSRYTQVWRDNMGTRDEPEITSVLSSASDFTRVTFRPDMKRFGIDRLGDNAAVMRRRVWDVAGCNSAIDVYCDGMLVPVESFTQYARLYGGSAFAIAPPGVGNDAAEEGSSGSSYLASRPNSRWEVGVTESTSGAFESVSFVNSIRTERGGTHVSHLAEQIATRVTAHVRKQRPDLPITPSAVKAHLGLFVNGMVENPSFESQVSASRLQYRHVSCESFSHSLTRSFPFHNIWFISLPAGGRVADERAPVNAAVAIRLELRPSCALYEEAHRRVDPCRPGHRSGGAQGALEASQALGKENTLLDCCHYEAQRRQPRGRRGGGGVHADPHRGRQRQGPGRRGTRHGGARHVRRLPFARKDAERARRQSEAARREQGADGALHDSGTR